MVGNAHVLLDVQLYHFRFKMVQWQNGFLGVSKAAALGWAPEALASAANAAPA